MILQIVPLLTFCCRLAIFVKSVEGKARLRMEHAWHVTSQAAVMHSMLLGKFFGIWQDNVTDWNN